MRVPPAVPLQLPAFYGFYFAYLGAFAPFFAVYLSALGLGAFEIGGLMALPQLTRILAPHLWGWLADRRGERMTVVRLAGGAGTVAFLGVFLSEQVLGLGLALFAMTFFWSAALPLVEATTLAHLGEETARYGRIRVWGSVGFIVAVVGVGYLLDRTHPRAVLWVILSLMVSMLFLAWQLQDVPSRSADSDHLPVWAIIRRREVIALILASALMAAAHGPYYTFYTLHLVAMGYTKAVAGWLWALGVVCEIGIFVWMSRLYQAFSLRQILIASALLAALRFLWIGWCADQWLLLLSAQALHAASFGAFHAAAIGVVHRVFRGRHQAQGQAIYGSLAYGLGGGIGGFVSGYVWGQWGAGLTFSMASACALLAALVLWRGLRLE